MRTTVERFFSILKDTLKLEHHRMEGLYNITLWCLFAVLAMLAFALASIRQGLFDRILKGGHLHLQIGLYRAMIPQTGRWS